MFILDGRKTKSFLVILDGGEGGCGKSLWAKFLKSLGCIDESDRSILSGRLTASKNQQRFYELRYKSGMFFFFVLSNFLV